MDRRKLVRTGAMVAWAVPAITVATAAPSFAASGCCDLSISGMAEWEPGENNYIDVHVGIQNQCSTAVSGLTVTLLVCGIEDIVYNGDDHLPAGWTQAGEANKALTPDANGCYTLVYMYAGSLAGGGFTEPVFVPKTKAYSGPHRPAGTVTVTVSSGGCSKTTVFDLAAI